MTLKIKNDKQKIYPKALIANTMPNINFLEAVPHCFGTLSYWYE